LWTAVDTERSQRCAPTQHHKRCFCNTHAKINRKWETRSPLQNREPENFIWKLCTRDYVGRSVAVVGIQSSTLLGLKELYAGKEKTCNAEMNR